MFCGRGPRLRSSWGGSLAWYWRFAMAESLGVISPFYDRFGLRNTYWARMACGTQEREQIAGRQGRHDASSRSSWRPHEHQRWPAMGPAQAHAQRVPLRLGDGPLMEHSPPLRVLHTDTGNPKVHQPFHTPVTMYRRPYAVAHPMAASTAARGAPAATEPAPHCVANDWRKTGGG